jgi:hypothetical protein
MGVAAKRKWGTTIEEWEKLYPDLVKGQTLKNGDASYWFECSCGNRYSQSLYAHKRYKTGACLKHRKRFRGMTFADALERCPDLVKGQTWRGTVYKYWFWCSKDHGKYSQRFHDHFSLFQGCPKCNRSRGEKRLETAALMLGIGDYAEQKRFVTCRWRKPLPFDGCSESLKLLFEYHGPHHYGRGRGPYRDKILIDAVRRNDAIKRIWAKKNGWHLVVIPF